MRKTRSQLRAEQIAQLQAEQAEHERSVETAMKVARHARCTVVEELYELLDVRAEQRHRESKSGVILVSTDKDETKRTARLLDAVTQLLTSREEPLTFEAGWGRRLSSPDEPARSEGPVGDILPTA